MEDFQDGVCDDDLGVPDNEAFKTEDSHLAGLASVPQIGTRALSGLLPRLYLVKPHDPER